MNASLEERKVAAQEQANEIAAKQIEVHLEVAKVTAQASITVAQIKEEGSANNKMADLEHKENMQTETRNAELDKMMLDDSGEEDGEMAN